MAVLAASALLIAVLCVAALVVVLVRRPPTSAASSLSAPGQPVPDVLAAAVAALRQEQAAQVHAAVETVVTVAGEQLASRSEAADRSLAHQGDVMAQALHADRQAIGTELQHARAQLERMSALVDEMRRERAEQQGRLEQRLAETLRTTEALAGSTEALRQTLASPKARGQWGERMADDVLRTAGFVEGVSYRKQTATAAGTIPDITFPLPGGRELHMDVKFPFDNYLRAIEAVTDAERDAFEARFLGDVKQRIREITTRSYIDADTTVDHVLLFIPNESIYAFVHEREPGLVDLAIGQKVVLCSPSTLFAVLAVVRQAVEQFRLERTSDEILTCLAAFEKEWAKWSDGFAKLGNQMATAARTYDALSGTRTNQLERSLRRIEWLRRDRGLEGIATLVTPAHDDAAPVSAIDPVGALPDGEGGDDGLDATPMSRRLPSAVGDGTRPRGPVRLK
jgi:DNA recombination protein RmuC